MPLRLFFLSTLLALAACGGGDDCDGGTPLLGGPNPECAEEPAPPPCKPAHITTISQGVVDDARVARWRAR